MAGSSKANQLIQAEAHVYNHIYSFIGTMSLNCAVRLGIRDIIHKHGQPITLSNLVDSLFVPSNKTDHVHRLMRLLVHTGFFTNEKLDHETEVFGLTPSSKLLLKDTTTNSLASYLMCTVDPAFVTPWNSLSDWFVQGGKETTFEIAHGMNFWNFAEQNSAFNKNFNEAMACDSKLVITSVIEKYGKDVFEKVNLRSLVDVGGGNGTAALAISEAYPHLKCSVLDLPHVVAQKKSSVPDELDYISGDMFEFIPYADVVMLKFVLHNWNDDDCVKILKRCREAISKDDDHGVGKKVIIIEIVMEDRKIEEEHGHEAIETQYYFDMLMMTLLATKERNEKEWEKIKVIIIEIVMEDRKIEEEHGHGAIETQYYFDMLMMTLLATKERNEKEWEKMFIESGFSHYKISPVLGFRSLIEVYPWKLL